MFGAEVAPYARRWVAIVAYAVMFVAGTAIALFRVDPGTWNLLWAEDGKEFLQDAYDHPFVENLFRPYAGYMHLVPRLIAEPISVIVPADWAAIAFTVAASAVWSAAALAVFDFARGHVRHVAIRAGLWALILLFPVGGLEVAGNIANAHWFLIFAAFWALAARDRSRRKWSWHPSRSRSPR